MDPQPPTPRTRGVRETYGPTDWVSMRRELLRSAPHPHAFPPRGEPLAKFVPTASHPTHPGVGMIYSPTGWVPELWEASRMQTHSHNSPPLVGNPWRNLGQQPPTPRTQREARFILQLVGRLSAGSRRGCPHTRTIYPLGGNPWRNLGRSPHTQSPIWGDPW